MRRKKEEEKKEGEEGRKGKEKNQSLSGKNLASIWKSQTKSREIGFVDMVLIHERRDSSLARISGSEKVSLRGMI